MKSYLLEYGQQTNKNYTSSQRRQLMEKVRLQFLCQKDYDIFQYPLQYTYIRQQMSKKSQQVYDGDLIEFFKFCSTHMNLINKVGSCRSCFKQCTMCQKCKKHDHNYGQSSYIDVGQFLKMVKDIRRINRQYRKISKQAKIPSFKQKINNIMADIYEDIEHNMSNSSIFQAFISKKSKQGNKIKDFINLSPKQWKITDITCHQMHKFEALHTKLHNLSIPKMQELIDQQMKYIFTKQLLNKKMLHLGILKQLKKEDDQSKSTNYFEGQVWEVTQKLQKFEKQYQKISDQVSNITLDAYVKTSFQERSDDTDQNEQKIEKENQSLNNFLKSVQDCVCLPKVTNIILKSKIPSSNEDFWYFFHKTIVEIQKKDKPTLIVLIGSYNKKIAQILQNIVENDQNQNIAQKQGGKKQQQQIQQSKRLFHKKYENNISVVIDDFIVKNFG